MKPSTTKMSSKGQVVIPEEIRNQLGLVPGTQFIVIGDRDVVILKALNPPSLSDFDGLIREARRQAKRAGLTKAAVKKVVNERQLLRELAAGERDIAAGEGHSLDDVLKEADALLDGGKA